MIAIRPTEAVQINVVDDHVEAYADVIEALGSDGYEVTTFTSTDEVNTLQLKSCSLWVIDKRFGHKTSGLELLKKLRQFPDKRIIMLTGYPVVADQIGHVAYNKELNNLSVVIQKPRSFRLEGGSLSDLIDEVFSAKQIVQDLKLRDFRQETELELYLALDDDEQDEVFDNVLAAHEEDLEKAWSSGAVWLCIFGVDGEFMEAVNDVRDIPEVSAIDAKCEKHGLPAFEIDRSMAFHNFGCSANEAHGGANISTYPHIKIEVPSQPASGFHFDSGADTSLFCMSFISSCDQENIEYVSRIRRRKKIPIQTQFHYVQKITVTAAVKYKSGQAGGKELDKGVTIPSLSVKNWQSSDLVASCSHDCKNSRAGAKCVFRDKGLLGRDFYVSNELKVLLSFENTEAEIIFD